jgi:hypothetical protein
MRPDAVSFSTLGRKLRPAAVRVPMAEKTVRFGSAGRGSLPHERREKTCADGKNKFLLLFSENFTGKHDDLVEPE